MRLRLTLVRLLVTSLSLIWFVLPVAQSDTLPLRYGGWTQDNPFAVGDGRFTAPVALSGLLWALLLAWLQWPVPRLICVSLWALSTLVSVASYISLVPTF